jgi:hypothetical protein
VIFEKNELNTLESEAEVAVVSTSVDADADPSLVLNKSTDSSSHELWWDVEDERYDFDDLCPISLV